MRAVRRWSEVTRAEGREAGAVSVFVVMLALVLLMLSGLIFDGGGALNARAKTADDVEQAARAGAQQIDLGALRANGTVELDPVAAQQAAVDYLTGLGYPASSIDTPQVTGNTVSVEVNTTYRTRLLDAVGITSFPVGASASARAAAGIDAEINPP